MLLKLQRDESLRSYVERNKFIDPKSSFVESLDKWNNCSWGSDIVANSHHGMQKPSHDLVTERDHTILRFEKLASNPQPQTNWLTSRDQASDIGRIRRDSLQELSVMLKA